MRGRKLSSSPMNPLRPKPTWVRRLPVLLVLLVLTLVPACSKRGGEGPDADGASKCQQCVSEGGTWQPEADQCTSNCDIQDISCFRDSCPEPCSADGCQCFSESECEGVGCRWTVEGEAAWCAAS